MDSGSRKGFVLSHVELESLLLLLSYYWWYGASLQHKTFQNEMIYKNTLQFQGTFSQRSSQNRYAVVKPHIYAHCTVWVFMVRYYLLLQHFCFSFDSKKFLNVCVECYTPLMSVVLNP